MKHPPDTLDEALGNELRLTRRKKHIMSSHLAVMEITDYISTDREEIKKEKVMSEGLCPQTHEI